MKGILELIKLLFGPKALSKTLGTRTNVIRLPNNKTKRYIKEDLNIEAASDELAQKAYKDMQELVAELPRMNDAERLIFEGNLRRLANKLGKTEQPSAEVITFGTKQPVSKEGIKSLTEQAGQKSPPGTLMGNLESRIKQLEARGEDLSKMKGQTLDDILGDVASSQKGMRQLEREGLVRATARDIITSDIKSGKLKLPKELEQNILEGGGEPIDILRNVYGEDALEVLDSLTPEFSKLRTSAEAEKLARSKFTFEPNVNRPKGSMSLEEAAKAEQENILTPGKKYKFTGEESMKDLYELERKGIITRDDMNVYSPRYIEWLDAQIVNKEKLYTPKEWEKTPEVLKNKMRGRIDPDWEVANFGEDFDWDKARALEIDETQKLTPKKPEEPEEFATGGIVNRVGFKFGTKFGRFWKIARKVWDDINPTGDRKYDAQLVADELAEKIFKTSMDDLPKKVQIDLYGLAYNNAPKVDSLFTNPQNLSEAAKKGMAASKEMKSLGLDVSKQSDFFKYENMKLSGELGPEHQVQAYKDKIRDEFSGVIDDTLMKQVEVDDDPQRLAEVYASIKEGLEMQKRGMSPEEIIRVMKQTPRTKNADGGFMSQGLDYLTGIERRGYAEGSIASAVQEVFPKNLPMTISEAVKQFGREAVYGKWEGATGEDPGTFVPGQYGQYYQSMSLEDPYEAGRLKEQYRPMLAPMTAVAPTPAPTESADLEQTYTANLNPTVSGIASLSKSFPKNPFYAKMSGLYPGNPFYSEDESEEYPNNPFYLLGI